MLVNKKHRMRMFKNRALRRIFGSKKDEALHNEELNDLYSSPNIIRVITSRRMRWAGHVARMGEMRDLHRVFCGKTFGKETIWKTQA